MKRRIVALFLALVMALGLAMPASATGLEGTTDPTIIGGAGEPVVITGGGVTTTPAAPKTGTDADTPAPTDTPTTGDSTTTVPTPPAAGDSTTTVPTPPATPADGEDEDESDTPMPLLGMTPLSGGTPVVTAVTTTDTDVPYLDATGASKICPTATVVEAGTDPVTWNSGWYVVNGSVTIDETVTVALDSDVHLILADGAELTVNGKETTPTGYAIGLKLLGSLTIYAQSAAGENIGKLTITAADVEDDSSHGINITSAGSLTVNGGVISATGGKVVNAETWNSGSFGIDAEGPATINGGEVTATGGAVTGMFGSHGIYVNSDVTIKGGTVTAIGGKYGIGGERVKFESGTLVAKGAGASGKAIEAAPTLPATYYWRTAADGSFTKCEGTTDAYTYNDTNTYVELTTQPSGGGYLSYKDWDAANKKLVDAAIADTDAARTVVDTTTTTWGGGTAESPAWYVVNSDVTISSQVTVTGHVNLILCDGKTLTVTGGIKVGGSNPIAGTTTTGSLTIYAQSTGESAGRLAVSAGSAAVTGIQVYCSSLTVNGGVITATGKEGDVSNSVGINIAGSSGNSNLSHSSMTVNSGTVTAIGKDRNDSSTGSYGIRLESGTPALTVNGGEVTATGGAVERGSSYGIFNCSGGSLTINDGTVTATGGTSEAGSHGIYNNPGSTLTITGGTLIAKRAADRNDAAVYLFVGATLKLPTIFWWRTSDAEGTKYNTQNTYTAGALGGGYFEITTKKPAAINADTPVPYLVWDSTEETLVEMKDDDACTEYTLVKSGGDVTWNGGWYVVKDDVTIDGDVLINGRVHLILCDGAKLTVTGCIDAAAEGEESWDTLSVHGQSTGAWAGKMTVEGNAIYSDDEYAWSCGISLDGLYLHGGEVTACGADVSGETVSAYSRGVNAYYVIVYGGSLTATGGDAEAADYAYSYGIYAVYGVDVHGGKITATGGEADTDDKDAESYGIYVDYGDLSVYDAEVTATGGDASGYYRYSEAYSRGIFAEDDVYIKDSVVKAYGGDVDGGYVGYVGYVGTCGIYTKAELAIRNSEVTATGGAADAYVDAESCGIYAYGDMTVKGDDTVVTATGGDATGDYSYSYGIYVDGYYDDNEYEYYGDLIIENSTVTATGGEVNGGDDAESCGIYVDDEDMTVKGEDTVVTATGGNATGAGYCAQSCGIYVEDDDLIIADGTVNATGGTATATGGDATGDDDVFSCGIYVDDYLIIRGGTVNATGGDVDGEYVCNYGIYANYYLKIEYGTVIAKTTADGTGAVYYYCSDNYCSYKMPDHYENNWWWRTAKNDPFRVYPDFYAGNAAALEEDYFELVTTEPEFIYGAQTPDTDTDHTDTAPDGAPIRRQNNAVAALVPSVPDKADVTSPETFDAGIAVYVGLGVLSLTGSAAWVGRRKKR